MKRSPLDNDADPLPATPALPLFNGENERLALCAA
jgi:hypothetical protein